MTAAASPVDLAPEPQPEPSGTWAYRAHLDGLRAIAVYLVVAFHAGIDRFSGGFIGVDVFFVLSGFLVTSLLLRDLQGEDGRVGFGRFYSRRARRLLPAAALNLLVTALVFGAIAAPVELADAKSGIRSAALYYANWHFLAQSSDYFAADVSKNPVIHYWSLSVEEQFYLVWPVLLGGLFALSRRLDRRRMAVVRLAIGLGALASAAWALSLSGSHLNRAYYGTDARAYELLAGALLAVAPEVARRLRPMGERPWFQAVPVVLVAGLVLLASSVLDVNPIQRGVLVTVATCVLILSLEGSVGGIGHRLLSIAPLTYLGRISYGTYLWHWLVIVVLAAKLTLSPLTTALVTATVATGLASLSYQLLEHPIRTTPVLDRMRSVVIVGGLSMSLLVGLVFAPIILDNADQTVQTNLAGGGSSPVPVAVSTGGAVPAKAAIDKAFFDFYQYGSCKVSGPVACPISTGKGPLKAIVIGESHAATLTPMLSALAKRHDMSLYAGYLSYCPWTRGIQYAGVGRNCFRDQDDLYDRIIPALDPDIVFLAHRAVDDPNEPLEIVDKDKGKLAASSPEGEAALDQRITALVHALRAQGRKVVMFEPTPLVAPDKNPLTCLSKATSVDQCRFVTDTTPGGEERVMRDLAAHDRKGVVSVNLDPLLCPYLPICDPVVNGMIVRHDANHMTLTFAQSLLGPIDTYLTGQGVFSG